MGGKRKISWLKILKQAGADFMEDKALRLSAAMAYYSVFSIGPLLFLMVGIAGLALGEDTVRKQVAESLKSLLGEQSSGIVESMMSARSSSGSLMATIIGGLGLLLGASGVFGQLQDALNTIWEVKQKSGGGIWSFIRNRLLSFGMVLAIGFLLLLSMVLTTVVHAATGQISNFVSIPEWLTKVLPTIASFFVISALFAAIFKFLPDVKIGWSDVWTGAMATAFLYAVGNFVLSWYLGRESTASAYGAGGAFVLILLYIYYSSVILFFGAELTQVYAKQRGTRIVPSANAVAVTIEERVHEEGVPSPESGPVTRGSPRGMPAYASSSTREKSMKTQHKMPRSHKGSALPPFQQIRSRPYSFVTLAAGAGIAAGLFFKYRSLRTGLKWFMLGRKVLAMRRARAGGL